jgi:hypothetical protein
VSFVGLKREKKTSCGGGERGDQERESCRDVAMGGLGFEYSELDERERERKKKKK